MLLHKSEQLIVHRGEAATGLQRLAEFLGSGLGKVILQGGHTRGILGGLARGRICRKTLG
jgi:hypothetical protein